MGSSVQASLIRIATTINDLLTKYIELENAIFGTPFWRSLPIPFLFKPIPFKDLTKRAEQVTYELSIQLGHLKAVNQEVQVEHHPALVRLHACLNDYTDRLRDAAKGLEYLGHHLARKADGVPYSFSSYRQDCDNYGKLRDGYLEIGSELNQLTYEVLRR
jgi:hypothetical protein